MSWLREQARRRPFMLALVVLALVVVPGAVRVEMLARQAQATADQVVVAQLQTCRELNTARSLSRAALHALVDAVDPGTPNPTIERLRAAIPSAAQQDQDCDGDGSLDDGDYAGEVEHG